MSKVNDKALNFFEKNKQSPNFQEGFERREASSHLEFAAQFFISPLTPNEDRSIQLILKEMSLANHEVHVDSDHKALLDITAQIRAIDRQGILLHGERISKARDVLKKYKDGAFTRWLELAYGNRQTPYRILQYYEFFKTLGSDIQKLIQSMPRKAAYVLASRDGDPKKKIKIIKEHHSSSPEEIIQLVQEIFPLSSKDRRKGKENDIVLVDSIHGKLIKIKNKNHISSNMLKKLYGLKELIEDICRKHKQD